MCSAFRFCLSVYLPLSPRAMAASSYRVRATGGHAAIRVPEVRTAPAPVPDLHPVLTPARRCHMARDPDTRTPAHPTPTPPVDIGLPPADDPGGAHAKGYSADP